MRGGWVDIMTNRYRWSIYIGVTTNLVQRGTQHHEGTGGRVSKEYGRTMLVYSEQYESIEEAIAREKALKTWRRNWKIRLIENHNPDWEDRYADLVILL